MPVYVLYVYILSVCPLCLSMQSAMYCIVIINVEKNNKKQILSQSFIQLLHNVV